MEVEDRKAELGTCYATHAKTVVAIVRIGRVDIGRIEVQVVGVAGIRVRSTRPVVAVVAGIVDCAVIAVVVATSKEIVRGIRTHFATSKTLALLEITTIN